MLLLDEPAAGVPKDESAALFSVIAALPSDISVLFIEHDMDIVFGIASLIRVLHQGRLIAEGPPGEISGNRQVIEAYLGEGAL